jgi:glycerol-3-phosphate acyltransferase PlsY
LAPELSTAGLTIGAYLLGSIPFGLLIGFALGVDIRKTGSGNIGATNLSRAAGRKWGITAFVLDFAKGLIPVLVARWLAAEHGAGFAWSESGGIAFAAGLAAIVGHVFPVYLAFRGGKGVATTFGVMAGLAWASTLAAGAVWAVLYLVTRTVSIGSMGAAVALPIAVACLERGRSGNELVAIEVFAAAMGLLILLRHRSNLLRLLRGEEHKFGGKK